MVLFSTWWFPGKEERQKDEVVFRLVEVELHAESVVNGKRLDDYQTIVPVLQKGGLPPDAAFLIALEYVGMLCCRAPDTKKPPAILTGVVAGLLEQASLVDLKHQSKLLAQAEEESEAAVPVISAHKAAVIGRLREQVLKLEARAVEAEAKVLELQETLRTAQAQLAEHELLPREKPKNRGLWGASKPFVPNEVPVVVQRVSLT
ncbi:hypothetical protein KFL_000830280 [Klebsormidium nitens]|uniref:Uncharacterized protein n=1 Tax=Klebsormidium nitens TaxID=105231 RepID=A0A1Y1HYE6_KLENI|nr:hypothetical protein KFL_000830280 [Klebsormidium nitens]|eukprot:GAQ81546.1 hypothetical protein KFL_000830280 [Klebsormidium nitens]